MKKMFLLSSAALFFMITFDRCDNLEIGPEEVSSFGLIQQKILNVSCAIGGCHLSESDLSFAEHKLILRDGVSYENMINVDPQNDHAQEHKLKIVVPDNPELSLLLHKI